MRQFHVFAATFAILHLCTISSPVSAQSQNPLRRIGFAAPKRTDTKPLPYLQPAQLLQQLDQAIAITRKRHLTAGVHSPWQIFHGILALKKDMMVSLNGEKLSAIDWLAANNPKFDNEDLIVMTPQGPNFHPFTRPWAFQGHPGQFLALISESNLPFDYKFKISPTKTIALSDIIRSTMLEVNEEEEITWVLWGLNHYLKTDAHWQNKKRETWSIEKLVTIQTQSAVVGTACGGNHGLFALARTRDKHLAEGEQLHGVWLEAEHKIRQYIEQARSLQNPDGSLSSDFYRGPDMSKDVNTRLNTTGHTLEFISTGIGESRLTEPWLLAAFGALSTDLIENQKAPFDCGPLYHSLNAVIMYRDRLAKVVDPSGVSVPSDLAKVETPFPWATVKPNDDNLAAKRPINLSSAEPANAIHIRLAQPSAAASNRYTIPRIPAPLDDLSQLPDLKNSAEIPVVAAPIPNAESLPEVSAEGPVNVVR